MYFDFTLMVTDYITRREKSLDIRSNILVAVWFGENAFKVILSRISLVKSTRWFANIYNVPIFTQHWFFNDFSMIPFLHLYLAVVLLSMWRESKTRCKLDDLPTFTMCQFLQRLRLEIRNNNNFWLQFDLARMLKSHFITHISR